MGDTEHKMKQEDIEYAIKMLQHKRGGTKRRVRVIPFLNQFVSSPVSGTNQRLADPNIKTIKTQSNEWRDAFVNILFEHYVNYVYKENVIDIPDQVRTASQEYIDDNNPVLEWLVANYDIGGIDRIKSSELYKTFKEETGSDTSTIKFRESMISSGLEAPKRFTIAIYWVGIKRKSI